MNVIYSDIQKCWLVKGVPATEPQVFDSLIVDGYSIDGAHRHTRRLKALACRKLRDVAYIADATSQPYFLYDPETNIGKRFNREYARAALRSEGHHRRVAELLLRIARKYDRISLADLTLIKTS